MDTVIRSSSDLNVISEIKRKISLLTKALVKEREENQKEAEEMETLKKILMASENSLAEKNSKILALNSEKEEKEIEVEKVKEQMRNMANQAPGKTAKITVASLEEQNKKLLDEYYTLKQQSTDLKNMKETLTIEYSDIKKQKKVKEKELEKVKVDSALLISQSQASLEKAEKELIEGKKSLVALQETQNSLLTQLESAKIDNSRLEQETEENNQRLLRIQGKISGLQQELLKLSENELALSEKLMEYKNELAEAETFYQKHEILKLSNNAAFPVSVVLKKDHNGSSVMEIEQEGYKKVIIDVWSISEVSLINNSQNRFTVKLNEPPDVVFESNKAPLIAEKFSRFISKSKQDSVH